MSLSIIIPAYNAEETLGVCLEAVFASHYQDFECILVNDGSRDQTETIARAFPVRVLCLDQGPHGPAYGRNRGAEIANGEYLFFLDADVVIPPEALSIVAAAFEQHQDCAALFGSYDSAPAGPELLTQYKNLFHHFVHQQGQVEANTFWSGCGAIRRDVFLKVGAFDEKRYPRPSIEDIELGYSLRAQGYRIRLVKELQAKHLKRWSFPKMVKSDIVERGIPWTSLILRNRNLPNDLNLRFSQRASAIVLILGVALLGGLMLSQPELAILPLLAGLALFSIAGWSWLGERLLIRQTPGETISLVALAGVVLAAAVLFKEPLAAAPVLVLALGACLQRWGAGFSVRVKWGYFALLLAAFGLAGGRILTRIPVWQAGLLVGAGAVVILLNLRFYGFFVRARGWIFAGAVVPFHFLYFVYNLISLTIGFGQYFYHKSRAVPASLDSPAAGG